MDEFSTSMNGCISQLIVELQQAESSTGTVVTRLRKAMEKKSNLRLPTDEVQRLRAEKQRLEATNELLAKKRVDASTDDSMSDGCAEHQEPPPPPARPPPVFRRSSSGQLPLPPLGGAPPK
eukprot:2012328-Amphidinium_carterae.1